MVDGLRARSVGVSNHDLAHWQVVFIGEYPCVISPVAHTHKKELNKWCHTALRVDAFLGVQIKASILLH